MKPHTGGQGAVVELFASSILQVRGKKAASPMASKCAENENKIISKNIALGHSVSLTTTY